MSEYRDIGRLNSYTQRDVRTDYTRKSQVYQATHNGEGLTLPYMNRSFISFTYGGKKIEGFNLIATISGDRMNRPGYAAFNDTVTTYDNMDGQYHWATHYQANQMDFTLSTDGIEQKELDDFLHWFKAGVSRELILSEHPNRGIMARVAQPPTLNLLPFEHDTTMMISSKAYPVKTTLYKGDISLSLIMDQPHWYSIVNILGKQRPDDDGRMRYVDYWDDITTEREVYIFASQDALKILHEDGIPLGSMIDTSMLLGNGAYANVDLDIGSLVWDPYSTRNIVHVTNNLGDIQDPTRGGGACIHGTVGSYSYRGMIAGAIVDATDSGIESLAKNTPAFFFYSGTAPATTAITFTLQPAMTGYYISVPGNSYRTKVNDGSAYNTITIESTTSQTLRFTTPNLFTSYNKAIDIFTKQIDGAHSWEDIRKTIRDEVRHKHVREWAIKCIEYAVNMQGGNREGLAITTYRSVLQNYLSYMFISNPPSGAMYPVTFSFNSETGAAKGYFTYKRVTNSVPTDENWASYGEIQQNVEEDVGDMLRSNYIIIQDRNYPTEQGKIVGWNDNNPLENRKYSHRIKHDIDGGVTNLQVLYKNMYL